MPNRLPVLPTLPGTGRANRTEAVKACARTSTLQHLNFSHPDCDRRLPARGSTGVIGHRNGRVTSGRGLAIVRLAPLRSPTTGRELHPTPKRGVFVLSHEDTPRVGLDIERRSYA